MRIAGVRFRTWVAVSAVAVAAVLAFEYAVKPLAKMMGWA